MKAPTSSTDNDYKKATSWMFEQLPMFQSIGAAAYKNDLSNIVLLLEHLGNPHQDLKCIHVAGTNGKGSTSHLLASILQESGYKVGLYTSPHLKDFRERIKINGNDIYKKYIVNFVRNNKLFFERHQLSFFEMTVGLAFQYFANQKTDINIIEVGMGGRLDATNVIIPLISVITNIGLDHTQFLGNTIAEIAAEKAGIIKPKIPVVIGEHTQETKPIFIKIAKECESNIYFASDLILNPYPSMLLGDYQLSNIKTVMQTIEILRMQKQYIVPEQKLRTGLMNVLKNTNLQGRWQELGQFPTIIADTGHNKHGLQIVLDQIKKQKFDQLHMVMGFVNDKDLTEILPLFPVDALYYFCAPNVPRGLPADELKTAASSFNLIGEAFQSVHLAFLAAKKRAKIDDFIFIGGSNFVVADVI